MTRAIWCASFVTMLLVAGVGSRSMTAEGVETSQALQGGASSKEELAQRLLKALERKDLEALRRLRVTESEYKDVIMAGTVAAGEALRVFRPEVTDYAWKTLNTKSLYYERYLLHELGGKHYELQDMTFAKGVTDYGTYRAYRQLRLAVTNDGSPAELATGSIAEVQGRYKFISFIRD